MKVLERKEKQRVQLLKLLVEEWPEGETPTSYPSLIESLAAPLKAAYGASEVIVEQRENLVSNKIEVRFLVYVERWIEVPA